LDGGGGDEEKPERSLGSPGGGIEPQSALGIGGYSFLKNKTNQIGPDQAGSGGDPAFQSSSKAEGSARKPSWNEGEKRLGGTFSSPTIRHSHTVAKHHRSNFLIVGATRGGGPERGGSAFGGEDKAGGGRLTRSAKQKNGLLKNI